MSTEIEEALRRLRRTPRHLTRVVADLSESELQQAPAEGEWSINEVLAHIRGAQDVQGGWIEKMLAEDDPTIRHVSPRTGMRKGNYAAEEFAASFKEFKRRRNALVKTLAALDERGWERAASFTGTTPGWSQTVLDVATGIGRHEASHFDQLSSTADVVRAR